MRDENRKAMFAKMRHSPKWEAFSPLGLYKPTPAPEDKPFIVKDGSRWQVMYANETKSKDFKTKAQAEKFRKQVGME